jgi:general nucleoside transport system permease protein
MTTTALSRGRFQPSRRQVVSALFTLFGAFFAYLLFNALIDGQCDARCLTGILNQTVRAATPIALAAYCGVMCERAGVINIGIEGMMLMGAMVGYLVDIYAFVAFKAGGMDPVTAGSYARIAGLVCAVLSGALLALLHAVVSIRYKTNQIISGTAINILAVGLTGYVYRQYLAENVPTGPGTFPPFSIPLLSDVPIVGPIFFTDQKPIVYLALVLTVVLHVVLFQTQWGLRTRAVGEHPRAADTLGINVIRTRYINTIAGGLIAGLAGAWFTLEAVDVFNPLMTNGLGFIGLAAMIFGNWSPLGAFAGALIFGLGSSVQATISIFRPDIPSQFPQMLPYILTMIVLTGVVGRATPPAADGEPYEKQ